MSSSLGVRSFCLSSLVAHELSMGSRNHGPFNVSLSLGGGSTCIKGFSVVGPTMIAQLHTVSVTEPDHSVLLRLTRLCQANVLV